MALNIPASVVAGEFVDENDWNGMVDSLSFLASPPGCRVYNSANISCTNNALTALTFDSERFDPTGMHSTSSNTGRITFNTAGIYIVGASVRMASASDYNQIALNIRKNGSAVIGINNVSDYDIATTPEIDVTTAYKFAAADYVELLIYQINVAAVARNALANTELSPEFWAVWVGLGT